MDPLRAGFTIDERRHEELNRQGRNYWWAYSAEILDRLGCGAIALPRAELPQRLAEVSLLFLEGGDASPFAAALDAWVRAGGVLIACNPDGLDSLFGNDLAGMCPQHGGEFAISGELVLNETPFSADVHSPLYPDKPLLIASPMRLVNIVDSLLIGAVASHAAITAVQRGAGWAFYFGFDLAQTFWVIQQGQPVDRDYDGDGYWRTEDAIVTADYEPEIAYTDELLFLLQNMIAVQPLPLIHQLPPHPRGIPNVLLHYGGDDEAEPGVQVPAAEFMHSRGLPYHINCMARDGQFAVNRQELDRLAAVGTELSLHYNFIDGFAHPGGFAEADVRRQTLEFVRRFGRPPVCTVNHWFRWTGWAEPALWMGAQGVQADNSQAQRRAPLLNPINLMGFAFGTSYPHFVWTDQSGGNRRIAFLELPITAYELGYDGDRTDFEQLAKGLRLAEHYQSTMSFFYHPVYIARRPTCRTAINKLLSLIDERGLLALHATPDELTRWWFDRSQTRIEDAKYVAGRLSFRVFTPSARGCIVKVPLAARVPTGIRLPHKVIRKFGRKWLMLVLPQGETQVGLSLEYR